MQLSFGIITLKKGSSTGYHKHDGEFEAMYILEGEGIHNDNGTTYRVSAGDMTITEDGESHSLENVGETDLKFIALVLKSNK
ncbi:cupin domain-containing protein [Sedimentibacter sp. zth1]|nr:cupin domain-containing protein [Sedimentibacter sp. zth1]